MTKAPNKKHKRFLELSKALSKKLPHASRKLIRQMAEKFTEDKRSIKAIIKSID